jgi:hypothetical protein
MESLLLAGGGPSKERAITFVHHIQRTRYLNNAGVTLFIRRLDCEVDGSLAILLEASVSALRAWRAPRGRLERQLREILIISAGRACR